MGRIASTRRIDAPVGRVFETVAHVENFAKVVPAIVKVEFVTPHSGVGTRFRETRRMGKREATVELEVTEFVANQRIRLVADAGGTVWDTVFAVKPEGSGTELSMVMSRHALPPGGEAVQSAVARNDPQEHRARHGCRQSAL